MDSFCFVTDTHFEDNALHSGAIIYNILHRTAIRKVFHGGDSCSVTDPSVEPNGLSLIGDNIDKFHRYLIGKSESCQFFNVRGNHDYNNRIEGSELAGYDSATVRAFLLATTEKDIVINDEDNDGTYYYYDNKVSKIRYIVVDCYYGNSVGHKNIGVQQFSWILNAINNTPSGYAIVYIQHQPLEVAVDQNGERSEFSAILTILKAVNNKRSGDVTYDNQSFHYDYSNASFNILFVLTGHIHSRLYLR
jgi:predicted phosphodiesterase